MQSQPAVPEIIQFAKEAGLRYVTDQQPGILRKGGAKRFRYLNPDGSPVKDPEVLARIKSLAIPPAWKNVWICPNPKGHLQATGRDAKGRKQSRYHPRWREVRDETKFGRMLIFGACLPQIRRRVEEDLALPGIPRQKVLATVVRLMETTYIRIGNTEYARKNHSFGLTTMRSRHVHVAGSTIVFKFTGKSGIRHTVNLRDRQLARIIRRCHDIPGYELFQYVDADGAHHTIDSSDVNEYLREISGQDFTAKDFRTWAGTVLASTALREFQSFASEKEAKKNVVRAVEQVAQRLRNTPSVCRKCYVHPTVLERYLMGAIPNGRKRAENASPAGVHELREEELHVIHILRASLEE